MKQLRYVLITLLLITLSACSAQKEEKEDAPKELSPVKSDSASSKLGEEELFQNGKRLFSSGLYSVAKESFEKLYTRFPEGPYSEFAELKMADAEFLGNDFVAAALHFDQFINNHPTSSNLPYALARLAQSHLAISKGVGRDIAPLEKAKEVSEKLLNRFPNSPYVSIGKSIRKESIEKLAAQELMIRDFYAKRSSANAAKKRDETYTQKWSPLLTEASQSVPTSYELSAQRASLQTTQLSRPTVIAVIREESAQEVIENLPAGVVALDCADNSAILTLTKPLPLQPAKDKTFSLLLSSDTPLEGGCGQLRYFTRKLEDKLYITVEAAKPFTIFLENSPPRAVISP